MSDSRAHWKLDTKIVSLWMVWCNSDSDQRKRGGDGCHQSMNLLPQFILCFKFLTGTMKIKYSFIRRVWYDVQVSYGYGALTPLDKRLPRLHNSYMDTLHATETHTGTWLRWYGLSRVFCRNEK